MFCTNCGYKLEGNLLFCTNCGNKITNDSNNHQREINQNQRVITQQQGGHSNMQFQSSNLKGEFSNFFNFFKSSILNPFNAFDLSKVKLPISLIYIAISSLLCAIITSFIIPTYQFSATLKITLMLTLSFCTFFMAVPGVFYLIVVKFQNKNIDITNFFNISIIALNIQLLFSVINFILFKISPSLFLLGAITAGIITIGIFYNYLNKINNNDLIIIYLLPIISSSVFFLISKVFLNDSMSSLFGILRYGFY